jgi:hypothetical protein
VSGVDDALRIVRLFARSPSDGTMYGNRARPRIPMARDRE